MNKKFLVIDDDPTFIQLTVIGIKRVLTDVEILTFLNPKEALKHIENKNYDNEWATTNLLLDLNMPIMDGWEFLNQFSDLPLSIQNFYKVYLLSSSTDVRDISCSKQYPIVKDYFVKPLQKEIVKKIIDICEEVSK